MAYASSGRSSTDICWVPPREGVSEDIMAKTTTNEPTTDEQAQSEVPEAQEAPQATEPQQEMAPAPSESTPEIASEAAAPTVAPEAPPGGSCPGAHSLGL